SSEQLRKKTDDLIAASVLPLHCNRASSGVLVTMKQKLIWLHRHAIFRDKAETAWIIETAVDFIFECPRVLHCASGPIFNRAGLKLRPHKLARDQHVPHFFWQPTWMV